MGWPGCHRPLSIVCGINALSPHLQNRRGLAATVFITNSIIAKERGLCTFGAGMVSWLQGAHWTTYPIRTVLLSPAILVYVDVRPPLSKPF